MWVNLRYVVGALAISVLTSTAPASIIADFAANYQPNSPRTGWAYLWNANGPVGNAANYAALQPTANNGGDYETGVSGNNIAVLSTAVIPGAGLTQDPGGIERCAILAYTISAANIAAAGNQGYIDDYRFEVPLSSVDGVTASIYVNNTPIIIGLPLPGGFVYDRSFPDAYPMPLGSVSAGDTIYVAIGGGATGNGDQLGISYTIKLVPEPAALSVLGMLGVGLLGRRRGR
jgi:hypothetical protein